ncbi:UPF0182 family protein, partial [Candidatus Woesearchaeota archaeon]
SGTRNSGKIARSVWIVFSLLIAFFMSSAWKSILLFLNQVPFGIKDPIFGKDISFFVFTLPVYELLAQVSLFVVGFCLIGVSLVYFYKSITKQGEVVVDQYGNKVLKLSPAKKTSLPRQGRVHLALLGTLSFFLLAVNHYLARYEILYSNRGAVFGAAYTDIAVSLPALTVLFLISFLIGIAILVWAVLSDKRAKLKKRHVISIAVASYLLVLFLGTAVIPYIVQHYKVSPNELEVERPYIENAIKYTRIAYNLDNVVEKGYDVKYNLSFEELENNKETIRNIRLLDWRPLKETYKQLQEIRLYYEFLDIDVDRYDVEGNYTQVMLSAREMKVEQLEERARTWLNMHLVYTHGYGLAMSPVNKVTNDGQPVFFVKDIPPQVVVNEESLKIDRPEIYYGEHDNEYAIVGTEQKEFDYPKGDENIYASYTGRGGVRISSFLDRLLMSIRFSDLKMLVSSTINENSRVQFYRNIQERVARITPFLILDADPYIVIADGKLFWIQDAYTATNRFPYSEPARGINYIRNSVKVVIDAFNGDVDYYVADAEDPLIRTWMRVFPKQFKSMDEMPPSLRKHIRYPEGLFEIQAKKFATYHMKDPAVFYNKEDVWELPFEIYGQGQKVRMQPYYVILKLPEWEKEEFIMMIPFTPAKKDNMIAWMAAKSDSNYGQLVLFKFPKERLIYGPMQIEARIDQDAEISQQLTLWSQKGSSVTRGNILVIPVGESILYVEPLYIQAERSQMPELKRVIVSDGKKVVMEESFEKALSTLLGSASGSTETGAPPEEITEESAEKNVSDALSAYLKAKQAIARGDWVSFGRAMDELGRILEENKG